MYIELDHGLVAGKVEHINDKTVLEGRKEERVGGSAKYLLNKYNISKLPVKDVLLKKGSPTEETLRRNLKTDSDSDSEAPDASPSVHPPSSYMSHIMDSKAMILAHIASFSHSEAPDASKDDREKQVKEEEEFVIGSDGEVFFDHDFGFFGAILACYNNHWVLKTSPDDWWNVIVR